MRVRALVALFAALAMPVSTPAGASAQQPAGGGWVLDAYGGLHPFGGAPAIVGTGWWPGEDLARGIAGGWVVDAHGGLHELVGAPNAEPSWYAPGQDLARGIAAVGNGGVVVDAYGGVHSFGDVPPLVGSWYAPGQDLARGVVLRSSGVGGWVLDAAGALHEFGDAPPVAASWSSGGADLARAVAVVPGSDAGWVLDAYGGLHPFGGAPAVAGSAWWPGVDLARGVVPTGADAGWVLDAYGGLHPFGSETRAAGGTWYAPGQDLARGASGSSGSRAPGPPVRRTVTYEVRTRGVTRSTAADLAASAATTYADPRGWRAAGIAFRQVESGGDFTLWLAAPGEVPRFSSACSSFYSCRVGRNVIINDDRFTGGSPYWPGSVDDYRDMVVNHETGHWLGLGHRTCPAAGAAAPVMMQQSKGLGGCVANPWPTPSELAVVR
jgi:hypothetical protein